MSRKDMFLDYKRELCAMDGFDDLADPLWTYLADFDLFTSDEDAEWIPVKYDGKEVGFLIALSGKLVRDNTLDYYLWDTYVKPPYRRLGLMRQTVENYVRNHPGIYGLVMMDVNEVAYKFWGSVMGKPDEIREWNWPGCRLYVYRKEKSERDRD